MTCSSTKLNNAYLYVDFWSIINEFKRRISTSAAMTTAPAFEIFNFIFE